MVVFLSCFSWAMGFCSFSSFVAAAGTCNHSLTLLSFPEIFSSWFLPHCLVTQTSHQNEKNKYPNCHKQHHPLWSEAPDELQLPRLEEQDIESCLLLQSLLHRPPTCFLSLSSVQLPTAWLVPINKDVRQAELSPAFPFALGEVVNCLLVDLMYVLAHALLPKLVALCGVLWWSLMQSSHLHCGKDGYDFSA